MEAILQKIEKTIQLSDSSIAAAQRDLNRLEREQEKSAKESRLLTKVTEAIRCITNARREMLKNRVEKLLSYGLTAVFGQKMELEVAYQPHGLTDRLKVSLKDSDATTGISNARGGGVVNVASFLMKVLMLLAYRPRQRSFFLLDEPFSMVSNEHLSRLAGLLRQLTRTTKIQMLLVTHKRVLSETADRVYIFRKVDGATVAEELRQKLDM